MESLIQPENDFDTFEKDEKIKPADQSSNRKMRWVFLIFIIMWLLASMILPVVTFLLTKNPVCLSLYGTLAPPVIILFVIARYLFRDERDIQLARIRHSEQKNISKKPFS
jgi:hypothetical protein